MQRRQRHSKLQSPCRIPSSPPSLVAILGHDRSPHHIHFSSGWRGIVTSQALSRCRCCVHTHTHPSAGLYQYDTAWMRRCALHHRQTQRMGTGRQGAKIALSVCRAKWLAERRPWAVLFVRWSPSGVPLWPVGPPWPLKLAGAAAADGLC